MLAGVYYHEIKKNKNYADVYVSIDKIIYGRLYESSATVSPSLAPHLVVIRFFMILFSLCINFHFFFGFYQFIWIFVDNHKTQTKSAYAYEIASEKAGYYICMRVSNAANVTTVGEKSKTK